MQSTSRVCLFMFHVAHGNLIKEIIYLFNGKTTEYIKNWLEIFSKWGLLWVFSLKYHVSTAILQATTVQRQLASLNNYTILAVIYNNCCININNTVHFLYKPSLLRTSVLQNKVCHCCKVTCILYEII